MQIKATPKTVTSLHAYIVVVPSLIVSQLMAKIIYTHYKINIINKYAVIQLMFHSVTQREVQHGKWPSKQQQNTTVRADMYNNNISTIIYAQYLVVHSSNYNHTVVLYSPLWIWRLPILCAC